MDNETLKENVSNRNQWQRILYMILFAVILYLVMMLVTVVVVVQLLFALITGKPNEDIGDFADDLSRYVYRIVAFLTYSDDRRPFPFDNWEQDDDAVVDGEEALSPQVESLDETAQSDDDLNHETGQK
ncbi:MAG: hypothetical protein Kow0083_15600 [Methylophaga sp.]